MLWLRKVSLGWVLAAMGLGSAWANSGIFSCVDGKGRRITSDRPIAECTDREQVQFNRDGTVKRTIPPTLTPLEAAAQSERDRKAAEDAKREAEARRLERALVARYPNQVAHDVERMKALAAVQRATGADQEEELRRLNMRFDDELTRLRVLWARAKGVPSASLP